MLSDIVLAMLAWRIHSGSVAYELLPRIKSINPHQSHVNNQGLNDQECSKHSKNTMSLKMMKHLVGT